MLSASELEAKSTDSEAVEAWDSSKPLGVSFCFSYDLKNPATTCVQCSCFCTTNVLCIVSDESWLWHWVCVTPKLLNTHSVSAVLNATNKTQIASYGSPCSSVVTIASLVSLSLFPSVVSGSTGFLSWTCIVLHHSGATWNVPPCDPTSHACLVIILLLMYISTMVAPSNLVRPLV